MNAKSTFEALKTLASPPPPKAPDEFWGDFRARVALHPQQAAERRLHPVAIRWAWAAACAILLLSVGVWPLWQMQAAAPTGTTIESYAVDVAHSAVLILNDESSESTMLWVVGMQETKLENGGTT